MASGFRGCVGHDWAIISGRLVVVVVVIDSGLVTRVGLVNHVSNKQANLPVQHRYKVEYNVQC